MWTLGWRFKIHRSGRGHKNPSWPTAQLNPVIAGASDGGYLHGRAWNTAERISSILLALEQLVDLLRTAFDQLVKFHFLLFEVSQLSCKVLMSDGAAEGGKTKQKQRTSKTFSAVMWHNAEKKPPLLFKPPCDLGTAGRRQLSHAFLADRFWFNGHFDFQTNRGGGTILYT